MLLSRKQTIAFIKFVRKEARNSLKAMRAIDEQALHATGELREALYNVQIATSRVARLWDAVEDAADCALEEGDYFDTSSLELTQCAYVLWLAMRAEVLVRTLNNVIFDLQEQSQDSSYTLRVEDGLFTTLFLEKRRQKLADAQEVTQ